VWHGHFEAKEKSAAPRVADTLPAGPTLKICRQGAGSTLRLPSFTDCYYAAAVARIRIAATTEIAEGKTITFSFTRDDRPQEGFVGRFKGKLFAYENTCRHIPLTLDYGDNRFFDSKGKTLICQTHGAVYEPDTGLCVRGPCAGASLFALEIVEEDGAVWFIENQN